ncbi:LOW QUALITY PROTEIN: hypothetical protein PanWU01x14_338360 [Parasponia andersonii]|uniref:Uncharacterized protein n=1 Tax=Parasponia andersonii TaxID=3476 RepID=A0A2P5AF56_PARAD|nr:LOW QUALITY PROTEIN: hypothetical protein PanWU01x14_338360 [Parasponia andersonii]
MRSTTNPQEVTKVRKLILFRKQLEVSGPSWIHTTTTIIVVDCNDSRIVVVWLLGHDFLVLTTSTPNGDVPEGPTFGPVPTTGLAKVPGLSEAIVVVVAKLRMG